MHVLGEAGISSSGDVSIVSSNDIFDNVIDTSAGDKKKDNFEKWTLRGLGLISMNDGGTYNTQTGVGNGSDYLYTKYKKINVKKYDGVSKYKIDTVNQSTNLPKTDFSKVYEFLSLWKNSSGNIEDRNYSSNGIKVKYDDTYSTKAVVGDIFESAPEMLFTLLDSSENTRELVDIFKYIMYIYTGTDYGISDETTIANIFDTNPYGGEDYRTY